MQGSFEKAWNSHSKDLRGVYAKRMQCHGSGMALMQPISGADCQPTCCGYFDRNGDWNLIARLTSGDQIEKDDYFEPLEYAPTPATEVEIIWQPKASLGVTAAMVDANAATPDGLPGGVGAEGHIQYSSSDKFGAVLITQAPVRLKAYNDEALFASWLSRNKAKLYRSYGPELKKYGLWIVTRTYTTKRASINAWMDNKKVSVLSLKAKAAMLGELGEDLDWREKAASKDWSHYQATTEHGVVVFIDGIEIRPMDWWLESVRSSLLASSHPRGRKLSRYVPDPIAHQKSTAIHYLGTPQDLKKAPAPVPAPANAQPEQPQSQPQPQPRPREASQSRIRGESHSRARSVSQHRARADSQPAISPDPFPRRPREESASLSVPPVRRKRDFSKSDERRHTLVADQDILLDAGISTLSRSQSLRKASLASSHHPSSHHTHSRPHSTHQARHSIHEERETPMQTGADDRQFEFFSEDAMLKGAGLSKEFSEEAMLKGTGLPKELQQQLDAPTF